MKATVGTMIEMEGYSAQLKRWPNAGKHIMAQFDAETVIVYQAYRPEIGHFAANNQRFDGEFSFNRMSWIKPNFLWMMYRSGWGLKEGQEITLAVRILRGGFEQILQRAVHSSFQPDKYKTIDDWKSQVAISPVRLQWDPDHHPCGAKLERRAIQLGLAGDALRQYANEWIVSIEDISSFVAEQRPFAKSRDFARLVTPREDVYPLKDYAIAQRIGID